MNNPVKLTIGTRGSPLALAQANQVKQLLLKQTGAEENAIKITPITTKGDKIQDRPLMEVGGKGLFTRELEDAMDSGIIDIAVHSSKDVPTKLREGATLAAFLPREDIADAFISTKYENPDALPKGAKLGTSSIRRAAQFLRQRPDLKIVPFRGNVQTRLQKLEDGVADATLLAMAGLKRLDLTQHATHRLDPEVFVPAPAQGAIGIETLAKNQSIIDLLQEIGCVETFDQLCAERSFLHGLDGSCRTPIAARSELTETEITLYGDIYSLDGSQAYKGQITGDRRDAEQLGLTLAEEIRGQAGSDFFTQFEDRS